MLNREDWLMIREMRAKGCYLKDIAQEMGVSERTIRRALKRGGPPPRRKRGIRPGKLDAYKAQVDQLLSEDVWNAEVIFAELRARGYTGGISILRAYIHPKRTLRKARGTVRFKTPPGKQLQSDWGQIDTVVAGETRRVHFAVNLLGFSRRFHVSGRRCARMLNIPMKAWFGPSSGLVEYRMRYGWITRKRRSCLMPLAAMSASTQVSCN